MAGSGQGQDAEGLDANERARWRKQALDWLRADLAAYGKELASGRLEARSLLRLQHWQNNADLVGLRDEEMVAKLPADEQEACRQLWADVKALLENVQGKTK